MHHDALVLGGSFAGIAAALQLARARRSVCVVDAGEPRNRFAAEAHGFFGHDGREPRALIGQAREQLQGYPTVTFLQDTAVDAQRIDEGFAVRLASGGTRTARKLLLAYGISDELPQIPGVAQRWGRSVLHCPYCHGYEFAGRRLAVLATMPLSWHQAMMVSDWGPTTLLLNGGPAPAPAPAPAPEALAQLARRGIALENAPVRELAGEGSALSSVVLEDGRTLAADALFLAAGVRFNSPIAQQLGCALDEGPMGPILRTDAMKQTTVPGVYAAGDIARQPHNATFAAADGVQAGTGLHHALVFGH